MGAMKYTKYGVGMRTLANGLSTVKMQCNMQEEPIRTRSTVRQVNIKVKKIVLPH